MVVRRIEEADSPRRRNALGRGDCYGIPFLFLFSSDRARRRLHPRHEESLRGVYAARVVRGKRAGQLRASSSRLGQPWGRTCLRLPAYQQGRYRDNGRGKKHKGDASSEVFIGQKSGE